MLTKNSGDWNSGDWNSGDYNSGDWNSGDYNSGDCNSGDYNSGDCNSGDYNSGNWNSGKWNSGYFNTNRPKVRIFNKETDIKIENIVFPSFIYFNLTEWISESNMTEKEKMENKDYKILGGYLKKYEYKEAFQKSWNNATEDDKEKLFKLPNFDAEIFKEISGIDVTKDNEKENIIKLSNGKEVSETTIEIALKEYFSK